MQTREDLLVQCYAWFPLPGDAGPDIMARAEYHIGHSSRNPNSDRIDRTHAITLEVIHKIGELPAIVFLEPWPNDLDVEIKTRIVTDALYGYFRDQGISQQDALGLNVLELIRLRRQK